MTRRLAVLRPEPGNAATCARVRDAGHDAMALPLFTIVALGWTPPDPKEFDALILTSANAIRSGGAELARFAHLPVHVVGAETGRAAAAAGFGVASVGTGNAESLIAEAAANGVVRALHLGGRETSIVATGIVAASIAVYASEPTDIDPGRLATIVGATPLLHSARAARRLAVLLARDGIDRRDIAIAAISPAVAQAAGSGWARVSIAAQPTDAALIDAAIAAGD